MIPSVVGYAGYKSYGDKPYSQLKPGQPSMERNFYQEATREVPDGKAVLSNFGRFESIYGQNVSKGVGQGDYKVPLKNNNTMCKLKHAGNMIRPLRVRAQPLAVQPHKDWQDSGDQGHPGWLPLEGGCNCNGPRKRSPRRNHDEQDHR